jgi:hypothetical protein
MQQHHCIFIIITFSREDLMKLLKQSPSMLEKRPAASTSDDKQVSSELEHDARLKASDLEAQWKQEANLKRSQAESETNKAAIIEKQLDDQKVTMLWC